MSLDPPHSHSISAVVHERREALAAAAILRGDVSWHSCTVRKVYVYYLHYDNKNEVLSPGIMDDEQDVRAISILTLCYPTLGACRQIFNPYYIECLHNTPPVLGLFDLCPFMLFSGLRAAMRN